MRRRDTFGLAAAPLLLRIMLGLTFLWAGLGKFMESMDVDPQDAALLDSMGVDVRGASGTAQPAPPAIDPPPDSPPGDASSTAAPTGGKVLRVYGLALVIHKKAHPQPDADGDTPPPIWPPAMATGTWPKVLALSVAITEIAAGVLVLVGLLTRVGALALASVMLGAIWLTQIGPAIASGDAVLGFLPNHPRFDTDAWRPLWWTFALFMSALALALAGPGAPALDNAVFARAKPDDDDD